MLEESLSNVLSLINTDVGRLRYRVSLVISIGKEFDVGEDASHTISLGVEETLSLFIMSLSFRPNRLSFLELLSLLH